MTTDLIKKLVLPLCGAAIASVVLALFLPFQGLFVNLATTFVGILLTVCYVDWILREHEKKRWARVQYRINEHLTRFAIHAVSEFRSAFRFGAEIFDMSAQNSEDPTLARADFARIAERILKPAASKKIAEMTQAEWKTLAESLDLLVKRADHLIGLYGDRIPLSYSL